MKHPAHLLPLLWLAACHEPPPPAPRLTDPTVRLMREMDLDGSGDLSEEELPIPDPRKAMEAADGDGDGRVSLSELQAGMAEFRRVHAVDGKQGGSSASGAGPTGHRRPGPPPQRR